MIRKSLTTIAQYLDIQGSRKSGFPEADEHSVFDVQKLIDYKEQYDEIFSDAVKGFLEDLSTIDVYSVKKVSDPEYQYDLKNEYAGGIFIVFTEDFKTYLIDTQGYDYMRYIYRIKNLDLVNNKFKTMKNSPDFGQMGFFETKKNKYIKTFDLFENISDKLSPELQQFLKIMDLEFPNQCNNLPLRTASGLGDLNVVKELLKHPSVDPSDMNNNALRNAAQEGKIDVIKELLNDPRVDPNVYGDMPLRLTAEGGYYDATVELLKDPRVNPKNVIFENIEDEEIRGLLLKIKNVPSVLRKKYLESGLSDDEKSDVSDFGDFGFFEGHIMNFKKMFESKHGLVEILLKYLKEYSQPGEHYWNDEVDQSFNDLVKLYPDFKVEIRDLEEQITSLSTDFEDIENEEDWIDQENYDQKYEKIKRKIESLIVRKDNPDLTNYGFFDSKNQNLNDLNNFTLNESAIEKRAINSLSNFNFFFVKISESYPLIFVTYSSYNLTIDHEKNELKIKNENLNWSKIYEFKSTFSMFLFLGNINVKLLELISKKILDLNSDIDEMWDFKFTEIREIIANVKRILSEESDFKDMGFFD